MTVGDLANGPFFATSTLEEISQPRSIGVKEASHSGNDAAKLIFCLGGRRTTEMGSHMGRGKGLAAFLLVSVLLWPFFTREAMARDRLGASEAQQAVACNELSAPALSDAYSWMDPKGDSAYSFDDSSGTLSLSTRGRGHDLYMNTDAPRLVRSIAGDFGLTERVSIIPRFNFQGVGLLVWQDARDYMYAVRWLKGVYVSFTTGGHRADAEWDFNQSGERPIDIRMERHGNQIVAKSRMDNGGWHDIADGTWDMSAALQVGPVLMNEWQDNALSAQVQSLVFDRCTDSPSSDVTPTLTGDVNIFTAELRNPRVQDGNMMGELVLVNQKHPIWYIVNIQRSGEQAGSNSIPTRTVLPACNTDQLVDLTCPERSLGDVALAPGEALDLTADGLGRDDTARLELWTIYGAEIMWRVAAGAPLPSDVGGALADQTLDAGALDESTPLAAFLKIGKAIQDKDPLGVVSAVNDAFDNPIVQSWLADHGVDVESSPIVPLVIGDARLSELGLDVLMEKWLSPSASSGHITLAVPRKLGGAQVTQPAEGSSQSTETPVDNPETSNSPSTPQEDPNAVVSDGGPPDQALAAWHRAIRDPSTAGIIVKPISVDIGQDQLEASYTGRGSDPLNLFGYTIHFQMQQVDPPKQYVAGRGTVDNVESEPLSRADVANGVQWRGTFVIGYLMRLESYLSPGQWGQWQEQRDTVACTNLDGAWQCSVDSYDAPDYGAGLRAAWLNILH